MAILDGLGSFMAAIYMWSTIKERRLSSPYMDIPRLTGRLASCARAGWPGADNKNMAVKDVLWLNSLNPGTV